MTHPSGAQLLVPAGALARPTRLTFEGITAPAADVLGAAPLGQAFEAGPAGQTFLKPVEVIVPFDPTRLAVGSEASTGQLRMAPRGSREFVALQTEVDLQARVMRAKTAHFTVFVPAQSPNPVIITGASVLPDGTVGVPYAHELAATGGTAPYSWSISVQSSIPPGLALGPNGALTGVPSIPTAFAFFVTATDSVNRSVQIALALTVHPPTNPVPELLAVTPASATEGSAATTVQLSGRDFVPGSYAQFDGTALATTFVTSRDLSASIPASALTSSGTHRVTVFSPGPGGGTSEGLDFFVEPAVQHPLPGIASLSPMSLPVSAVDTQIEIAGTNFIPSTAAAVGSQGIPTQYISPTAITASVPASFLSAPGTLQIAVYNPPPGGGFSVQALPLTVGSQHAVPVLSSVSPTAIVAGAAGFTLDLNGSDFVPGGMAFLGGVVLATTVLTSSHATALVPAALIVAPGSSNVTFVNPTPGGGASGGLLFTVTASSDAGSDASMDASGDGSTGGVPFQQRTTLAAGNAHTCAIVAGSVKCWGQANRGQLGPNSNGANWSLPVVVPGLVGAVDLAAGEVHSCALLSNGSVRCWGEGTRGQLGDGSVANSPTPVEVVERVPGSDPELNLVQPLQDVVSVSSDWVHTCAIRSTGGVVCWGYNQARIGDGTVEMRPIATPVPTVNARGVGASWGGGYALSANGTAQCWGEYNHWGQCGDGGPESYLSPISVPGLSTAIAIESGGYHACAIVTGNTLRCWGNNGAGSLGIGVADPNPHPTPEPVAGLSNIARVSAGGGGTCALTFDHRVYCWGAATKVGTGTLVNAPAPVELVGLGATAEISVGSNQTCARLLSGGVKCWGYNRSGELGDGTTSDSWTPVAVIGL